MSVKSQGLLEKFVPVLLLATIVLAFLVGVLWQKVSNLESKNVAGTQTGSNTKVAGSQDQEGGGNVTIEQIKDLFSKDLIKFGDAKKKVLFVEISDPSCPFCHIASGKNSELNKQVDESYKKRWQESFPDKKAEENKEQWQRFTLVADGGTYVSPVEEMRKLIESGKAGYVYIYQNGHGAGEVAQKALYCAYDMGKFWQVHDLLMTSAGYDFINNTVKNDKTKSQELANFLKSAIDSDKLKKCLDSGKYDERLTSDMALAASLGVRGTPGFFVNATNFAGAYSWDQMKPIVDEALK